MPHSQWQNSPKRAWKIFLFFTLFLIIFYFGEYSRSVVLLFMMNFFPTIFLL